MLGLRQYPFQPVHHANGCKFHSSSLTTASVRAYNALGKSGNAPQEMQQKSAITWKFSIHRTSLKAG
ncbi:MAG: hypothetical protein ACR2LR_07980 [Hassallia sp.]